MRSTGKLPGPTEAAFLRQVIQFAKLHNWRVAHFRPAMTQRGKWVTPVQADGVGFPDLIFVGGRHPTIRMIVAELKVGSRKPTVAQMAWLDAFEEAGIPAYIWYPKDWPQIERILRGGQ